MGYGIMTRENFHCHCSHLLIFAYLVVDTKMRFCLELRIVPNFEFNVLF
jgi:hypothetical protein